MSTTQVGTSPVKIVDANDPQGVILNRSLTNQVFWGTSASQANRADASILDPNGTISVDTDAEVWMQCPTGTAIVDYMPHGQGFFRGLTSGGGTLVLPLVQSVNYVPGVNGWAIFSNGNVEFNSGTFRGTVTASTIQTFVTVASILYQLGLNISGGPLMLPGFSVESVAAPPVNPSGVYGESSATTAVMALWSGVAAAGDVASYVDTQSQVHSGVTNGKINISAGQVTIGPSFTIFVDDVNGQLQFKHPVTGVLHTYSGIFVDASGNLRYMNSGDGNAYAIGQHQTSVVSGQTINNPVFANITGASVAVQANQLYKLYGFVVYHGVSGSGNGSLGWATPAITRADGYNYWIQGSPSNLGVWNGSLALANSPTPMSSGESIWYFEMFVKPSAAGNMQLQAAAASGTTWMVDSVEWILEPI